jgi:hypothetical protein
MNCRSLLLQHIIAGLVLVLTISVSGCGDRGGGHLVFSSPGQGPGGDIVPPSVISATPETGAAGIKINSVISVDFSEYVNQSTVSISTFILNDAGNNSVTGSVVCNGTSASFTPVGYLTPNTIYTATITNGVTDLSGNHLNGYYSWSFTTSSSTDVTPPTVVSSDPSPNAFEINVSGILAVTFSEPIDPATITPSVFTLRDHNDNLIGGTVSGNANSLTFNPFTELSQKMQYTACITTSAMDLAGNALMENYCWTFTTGFKNSGLFHPYIAIATGSSPEAVAIGDVTGDGKNDVVMVTGYYFSSNDFKLFLFAQNSTGALSPAATFTTSGAHGGRYSVAIGDINNDGKNEVAVGSSDGTIEIFLQDGLGGLVSNAIYTTVNANHIKIGDFNHDGRLDVVGVGFGTIDVFLQNVSGTLGPPVTYDVDPVGWDDLEVGDVNNDGLIDIIVMNGSGLNQKTGVLTQKADGTFNPAVYYSTPAAISIGVGDVNGDGLNDVVVTDGGMCVLSQNAMGTFNPEVCYASYNSWEAIEVADVNQDSRKDVILIHYGWMALGVYLQANDGSLLPEELYSIPYGVNNLHSLAIGDINNDGLNDIVTVDRGKGLIILYHK